MALGLILKELFQKSDASGERSTILKPLTWLMSILMGGIAMVIYINAPKWILVLFAVVFILIILLFVFAYVYCLFNDKDAICSEKYSIQKMAIEKGYLGDSSIGLLDNTSVINLSGSDKNVDSEN